MAGRSTEAGEGEWFALVLLAILALAVYGGYKLYQGWSTRPSGDKVSAAPAKAKESGWQRMKDCAEQVERRAKQAGWVEGKSDGLATVTEVQNHYSAKHDKCYVLVTYRNHDDSGQQPMFFDRMYDAFEARELAMCTTEVFAKFAKSFCRIDDRAVPTPFDCEGCRNYIADHME